MQDSLSGLEDRPWSRMHWFRKACVVGFVAVQISIPTVALVVRTAQEGSRPTSRYRYSWQMFSTAQRMSYLGTLSDGTTIELSADHLSPFVRAINYGDHVQTHLCSERGDLTSVLRAGDDATEAVPC